MCFSRIVEPGGSPMAARDLTPIVDLTLEHGTGPFRTRHPVWSDLHPPCNNACPAGKNIQGWLAHVQAGDFRRAWKALAWHNPLPATHGRSAITRANRTAIAAKWTPP